MAVGFARSLLQNRLLAASTAGRGGTAWGAILRNSHPRRFRSLFTAWLQRRLVALLERPVRAIVERMDRERDARFVRALASAPSPVICPNCRRLHAADLRNCPECGHGPTATLARFHDDADCTKCGQPFNGMAIKCPYCGHERTDEWQARLDAMRREGF